MVSPAFWTSWTRSAGRYRASDRCSPSSRRRRTWLGVGVGVGLGLGFISEKADLVRVRARVRVRVRVRVRIHLGGSGPSLEEHEDGVRGRVRGRVRVRVTYQASKSTRMAKTVITPSIWPMLTPLHVRPEERVRRG